MPTRAATLLLTAAFALGALSCTTKPESAATWTDDTLLYEVLTEGEPDFGQHLLLEQHIDGATTLHTRIPVDLPETWRVRDMRLVDHRLEIVLTDDRTFRLDPHNLDTLQRAILTGTRPKPDAELDALWTQHAR